MEKIKRKKGFKYREMIYMNGSVIKSPTFNTKREATEWKRLKEYERSQISIYGHVKKPNMSLKDFANEWIENKVKSKNSVRTYETYSSDIKNHIIPTLGNIGIGFIGIERADLLISKLRAKNLTNRTINKVVSLLKTMLNDAVHYQYIIRNPIASIKDLRVQERADLIFTALEINRLLEANKGSEIHDVLILALNSGLRLGEILGLQWDRISLANNCIEITRTLTRHGNQNSTKTSKKRTIAMNEPVRNLITRLHRDQKSPVWVFVNSKGNHFDVNHFTQRHFKKALKNAGLSTDYRFHDIRHTFASHFMMNGGNLYTLKNILGHSDMKQTQRYAHLSQDHLDNSLNLIKFGNNFNQVSSDDFLRIVK